MEARYLKRKENGVEERFYPITHIDAVIGAVSKDKFDSEIANVKAQMVQQTPLFANSIEDLEENGDTSKVYVLPNGDIAAYMPATGGLVPNFTNLADPTPATDATLTPTSEGWIADKRINSSKNVVDAVGFHISNTIQCGNDDVIRVQGMDVISAKNPALNPDSSAGANGYSRVFLYVNGNYYSGIQPSSTKDNFLMITDNYIEFRISDLAPNDASSYTFDAIRICGCPNSADLSNIIITVNEEITYSEKEAGGYSWQLMNLNILDGNYHDLVGFVNENNVIYLTGNNLPAGTYTLKYADGNYDTIGNLVVE